MNKKYLTISLLLFFPPLAYARCTTGRDISNINSGNVNVGTTTSTSGKLTVYITGDYVGVFRGATDGAVGIGPLSWRPFIQGDRTRPVNIPTDLILNYAGGNIGIGTSLPASKLHAQVSNNEPNIIGVFQNSDTTQIGGSAIVTRFLNGGSGELVESCHSS